MEVVNPERMSMITERICIAHHHWLKSGEIAGDVRNSSAFSRNVIMISLPNLKGQTKSLMMVRSLNPRHNLLLTIRHKQNMVLRASKLAETSRTLLCPAHSPKSVVTVYGPVH